MAIEKEKVISKLKEEGIDEKFGNGVSFETEEELNNWVGEAKTLLVKPKSLEDYTADELEALLKDPQPKAKGLQALLDKERNKAKKKTEKKDGEVGEDDGKDDFKTFMAEAKKRWEKEDKDKETKMKASSFNSLFNAATKGIDEEDKEYIKATLNLDSTEDDIKKAVSKYTAMMTKRGFKDFGTGGSDHKDDKNELPSDYKKYIEDWAKKKQEKELKK